MRPMYPSGRRRPVPTGVPDASYATACVDSWSSLSHSSCSDTMLLHHENLVTYRACIRAELVPPTDHVQLGLAYERRHPEAAILMDLATRKGLAALSESTLILWG